MISVKVFSHKLDGREHLKTIKREPITDGNTFSPVSIAYLAEIWPVYWNGIEGYYIVKERMTCKH